MDNTYDFINDPPRNGLENMEIDQALLNKVINTGRPSIRVYQWNKPTLSLGISQKKLPAEFLRQLNDNGIDWVIRPSGGRAVLHGFDITYSITAGPESIFYSSSISNSFNKIAPVLLTALSQLGINNTAISGRKPRLKNSPLDCYQTISFSEITWNNNKLIGSAQLRRKNCLLQHGIIPLTNPPEKLLEICNIKPVTTLTDILGNSPDPDFVKSVVLNTFKNWIN